MITPEAIVKYISEMEMDHVLIVALKERDVEET
jgi:hypothetical protein